MVGGEIKVVMTLDNNDFSIKTIKAGQLISDFKRNVEQTAASTKKLEERFTSFGQRFRDLTFSISVARFALRDIQDIFLSLPTAVVKSSAAIERATKLLEGLSNKADEAARKAEALSNVQFVFNMAKNAPFAVSELTDTFVKLRAVGIDPTNGSMQTLVDSVARFGGTSDQLKRASIAIQQMAGKGVVSMEELRQQLGEAIPDAIEAMAVGTGMSMADLVKRISKGEVEARSALERMFAVLRAWNDGAAREMMGTWNGQVEQLKTNLTLMGNEIGESGFFSTVKAQLQEMNKWFKTEEARKFAVSTGAALTEIAKMLSSFIGTVIKYSSEIKMLATAMAAVWTAKTLRYGLTEMMALYGRLVTSHQTGIGAIIAGEKARFAETMAARKAEAQQTTVLENKALLDKQMAQNREIANFKAMQAEKMALSNAFYQQAMAAEKVFQTARNASGRFVNAAERAEQAALANAYMQKAAAAQTAAIRISQAEIAARNAVAQTNAAIVAQSALMEKRAAAATGVIATSVAGIQAVGRGLLAVVGGPLGAITTLLTIGAFAWMEWGNKAADAVKRAKDALKAGVADSTTVSTFTEQRGQLLKQEAELQAQLQSLKTKGIELALPNLDAMVRKVEGKLAEVRVQIKQADKDLAQAKSDADKRWVADGVRRNDAMIAEKLEKSQAALDEEKRQLSAHYKGQTDKAAEFGVELGKLEVKRYKEQQALLEQSLARTDAAIAKSTGKTKAAYQAQRDSIVKSINETAEKLRQAELIATPPQFMNSKKGNTGTAGPVEKVSKTDNRTPLQKFIDNVEEDSARLKQGNDKVKGLLAEFDEMVANNAFKYQVTTGKGKNKVVTEVLPTEEELAKAREVVKQFGELQVQDRENNRIIAQTVSVREQLARMIQGADLQIQAAEENMNAGTKTAVTNRMLNLQKQLAAMKAVLEKAKELNGPDAEEARKALENFDEVAKKITGAEAKAQVTGIIQDMRKETMRYEEEAVFNNRERAERKMNDTIEMKRREVEAAMELAGTESKEAKEIWAEYLAWRKAVWEAAQRQMETPMQRMLREWKDTTTAMQRASAQWLDDATERLVQFVKTGKLNFSELVDSILTDIIRIQMRKQIAGIFDTIFGSMGGGSTGGGGSDWLGTAISFGKNLFGFANGGIMTSKGSMPLNAYANGGIANSPQLALFGEGRMPEAYVPLPDGRTIPVTMTGGGMGGNVVVNVINNAAGTQAREERSQNADGSTRIDVIIEQVEGKLAQSVSKGRGPLSQTLEKTYGLNRAAGAY